MSKKKRGLPKGRTNNPHGRPPSVAGVERLNIWLGQEESDAVTREAEGAGAEKRGARVDAARRLIRKGAGLTVE